MLEPLSISLGLIIGGGLGTIAGGLFAGGRRRQMFEIMSAELAFQRESVAKLEGIRAKLGRELAEYRASRSRSNAPLRAANEARHAKAEAAKAAARELTARRHAEMRELVGEVI